MTALAMWAALLKRKLRCAAAGAGGRGEGGEDSTGDILLPLLPLPLPPYSSSQPLSQLTSVATRILRTRVSARPPRGGHTR